MHLNPGLKAVLQCKVQRNVSEEPKETVRIRMHRIAALPSSLFPVFEPRTLSSRERTRGHLREHLQTSPPPPCLSFYCLASTCNEKRSPLWSDSVLFDFSRDRSDEGLLAAFCVCLTLQLPGRGENSAD